MEGRYGGKEDQTATVINILIYKDISTSSFKKV